MKIGSLPQKLIKIEDISTTKKLLINTNRFQELRQNRM